MNGIPQEIQQWIDKDTELLKNGSEIDIAKYLEWFKNPTRDMEPNHQSAIEQLISDLNYE